MDPELLELLNRLRGEGDPLNDAELADLRTRIHAVRADIDTTNPSLDDIATLTEVRDNLKAIKTIEDERTAERTARAEEAAAIIAEIPEPPVVEEVVAEVEVAADPPAIEEVPDAGAVVTEAEQVIADAPAPVAAASAPPAPPKPPSISHLAARRPTRNAPVARQTVDEDTGKPKYGSVLMASANLAGMPAGSEIDGTRGRTMLDLGKAIKRTVEGVLRSGSQSDGEPVIFATKLTTFPEERMLRDGDIEGNTAKMDAVTSPQAITAAGGICGPVAVDYTVQGISIADRPVTTAAAQFGATRGGLRYVLPHTLASVTADGPASLWTQTNDANPTNPITKPHATYVCQNVQEQYVDAITSSVQYSNFQGMFFPEALSQYLTEMEAVHARLAEGTMLSEMITGCTWQANEATTLLGTARDILAALDRSASAIRFRNRMGLSAPLRVVYPGWLNDNIRTDLARQLPGDSGGQSERLAVADAEIANFFKVRNLNVTLTLDSPTGEAVYQGFVVQGNGALLPWPSQAVIVISPEGSFTWMNGGELNLGMIRSATLALTNQVLFFSETFEKMIFRGHEAGCIRVSICPSGATAGTVVTSTYCGSGS